MYYTKNIFFSRPGVPAITTQQKFILIKKYLHFVDNTKLTPEHSHRAKIACQSLIILLIHSTVIIY